MVIRSLPLLAALVLLAVAAPPSASAAAPAVPPPHRGETGQGKGVTVRTDAQRRVARVTIGWSATCRRGRVSSRTVVVPPRRATTTDRFAATGTFTLRQKGGVRTRVRLVVEGLRDTAIANGGDRWTGTIAGTAVVRRRGKVVDRCRLRETVWSAARTVAAAPAPAAGGPAVAPAPPAAPSAPGAGSPPADATPRDALGSAWSFDMSGDAGDYITGGVRWVHGPPDRLWVTSRMRDIAVSISTPNDGDWMIELGPPSGQVLTPGTRYTDAARFSFHRDGAGLSVTGMHRACNTSTGEFTIHDLVYDPAGYVTRLRASFVQYCEGSAPAAARGTIDIAAAGPAPVPSA